MKMALDSAFGGVAVTALQGGAIFTSCDRKRGEKQSNRLYYDFSDDMNEEGEIEDGEIVDSQDEDFGGEGGGDDGRVDVPITNFTSNEIPSSNGPSIFQGPKCSIGGQSFDNTGVPTTATTTTTRRKKKKRKRKRPLAVLMEMGLADGSGGGGRDDGDGFGTLKATEPVSQVPPAKKKKKLYVDHDKVNDDPTPWYEFQSPKVRHQPNSDECDAAQGHAMQPDDFDTAPFGRSPPPVHRRSRSPPGLYDSPYESDENEGAPLYGGGCGRFDDNGRQGHDDVGVPRQHMRGKRNHNGRGRNKKRGKGGRGGGGNGGVRAKQQARREKKQPICKFYMEGKCHKGSDCIYKHDGDLPKRMDICKFYLNSFCSKGDSCIYMHHPHEYPCKFFHTGAKCFSAENCKFSHDPLTDETRMLLEKCLDKGDDDGMMDEATSDRNQFRSGLLGSPPSHNYGQQDQSNNRETHKKGIPSLFDIRVDVPMDGNCPQASQLSPSQEQRHQHELHNNMGSNGLGFYAETLNNGGMMGPRAPLLPLPYGAGGGPQSQTRFGYDQLCRSQGMMGSGPAGRKSNGGGGSSFPMRDFDGRNPLDLDLDDRVPYFGSNIQQDTDLRMRQMRSGGSEEQGYSKGPSWRSPAMADADNNNRNYYDSGGEEFDMWDSTKSTQQTQDQNNRSFSSGSESETSVNKEAAPVAPMSSVATATTMATTVESNSDNIQIPFHLPKKQRELFLRIQQQQREAEKNIQAKAAKKKTGDMVDTTKDETDEREKEWKKENDDNDNDDDNDYVYESDEAIKEKPIAKSEDDDDDDDDDDRGCGGDDDVDDEKEKWYSSDDDDDDEDQPLTAVLKKLQQQPIPKQEEQQRKPISSVFNIAKMIQSISSQSPKGSSSLVPTEAKQSPSAVLADLSRDPRAQRHVPQSSRDPRNVDSRDPRSTKQTIEHKPRETLVSSNAVSPLVQVASPRHVDPLKSQASPPQSAPIAVSVPQPAIIKKERKPSVEIRSPEYLMPYKLVSVSTSHIDYNYMLNSSELDPTLLLKDPRLTRQLANKINSETSDPKKKSNKDTLTVKGDLKGHMKGGEGVHSSAAGGIKPGLHRLGVVTMPCPHPSSNLSSSSSSYSRNAQKPPTRQMGSLDDVDELWSVDEDNLVDMPTVSARVIMPSPVGHVKDYRIAKRTSTRFAEDAAGSSSSSQHQQKESTTSGQPAKIRGGSYQRKSSMEYASPLGYDDDVKGQKHSSGYDSGVRLPSRSPNKNSVGQYARQRNSLDLQPRTGAAAAAAAGTPSSSSSLIVTPKETSGDAIKPLKEIFKTIDPTASPFC